MATRRRPINAEDLAVLVMQMALDVNKETVYAKIRTNCRDRCVPYTPERYPKSFFTHRHEST